VNPTFLFFGKKICYNIFEYQVMRNLKFETGNYYHIYNRGVDHRDIFGDEYDFVRMIRNMRKMNDNSTKDQRDYVLRKVFQERRFPELSSGYPELSSLNARCPELSSGYPELSSLNARCLGVFAQELRLLINDYSGLVEIICYCLNKNHYHFLVKQQTDKGIEKFFHKIGTSYTNYFNLKYKRKGSLFEASYKSAFLNTQEKILRASAYINGNPEVHKIMKAEKWPWSSYRDYLGLRNGTMCHKEMILNEFKSIEDYREFVTMIIVDEQKIKEKLAAME
jgi:putative transposase